MYISSSRAFHASVILLGGYIPPPLINEFGTIKELLIISNRRLEPLGSLQNKIIAH